MMSHLQFPWDLPTAWFHGGLQRDVAALMTMPDWGRGWRMTSTHAGKLKSLKMTISEGIMRCLVSLLQIPAVLTSWVSQAKED